MKLAHFVTALLLAASACASEQTRWFLVMRPSPGSHHSEMDVEAALARIDACFKRHGFRSQAAHRKTPSGFSAALQWTKPGVGVFSTYTHADGRLAIVSRSTDPQASSEYIEIQQWLRAMDHRTPQFTVHEATRL